MQQMILPFLENEWMPCFEDRPMIAKMMQMLVDRLQDIWCLWRLEHLLLYMHTNAAYRATYTAHNVMTNAWLPSCSFKTLLQALFFILILS